MERDQFEYRKSSKIISIVQLVLYSIALFFIVLAGIALIFVTVAAKNGDLDGKNITANSTEDVPPVIVDLFGPNKDEAIATLWITFVIGAICNIVQLVAAVKLFKATKIEADAREALGMAKFWRVIMIVFTIIGIISYAVSFSWIRLAITLVVHGLFIYVVWKYIDELEAAVGGNIGKV